MIGNEKTNVKVGIYTRVSTEEQAKEGYSIKAQVEKLTDYCRLREWEIGDIYSDPGISGKNITERPDINRMIKDILLGKINTILVYKVDRLTRSTKDLSELVETFNENECDFISLSESIDTQTASGRMFLKIIGIFAEFERENIVERTKFGMAKKVKDGYSLCRKNTSFGYSCNSGKEIQKINEEEAQTVKWIFNKFLNDNVSISNIRDELNMKGIKTNKNNIWTTSTLCRLLRNVNYIGKVRHNIGTSEFEEFDGLHEAILDIETFEGVQKKLGKNEFKIKTKRPKDENFFTGTVYCSICGTRMTTQGRYETRKDGSKKYIGNYRCPNKEHKVCQAKDMSHSKLEDEFVKYIEILEDLKVPEEFSVLGYIENKVEEFRELHSQYKKELEKKEKKEKEIMTLYINGSLDFDEYNKMCKIVKTEIQKLSAILEDLNLKVFEEKEETLLSKKDIITNIKENWLLLTNNEKMQFVNTYIKKIVACNHNQENTHYGKIKIETVEFYSS